MTQLFNRTARYNWITRLLLCFGILSTSVSHAQKFSFLSYSNSVGLPQSQVQAITQDYEGYLWVGTLGGLAKFNGKKFIPFPIEKGILNNRISCLKTVKKKIWVGHQGGVSLIEHDKATSWSLPSREQNNAVLAFAEFNNTIYIAVEGGGIYYKKGNSFVHIPLPNDDANTCRSLLFYKEKLLVGTKDGLYSIGSNNKPKKNLAFGSLSISGISAGNQKIIVTTFNNGFFYSNAQLSKFESGDSFPEIYISGAITDSKKSLWAITDKGILCYKGKNRYFNYSTANGMPTDAINCVFQDSDGTIWLGSDGKGLLRFCGEEWAYFNRTTGILSDFILSGKKASNNTYLIGTYDIGAFEMSGKGICKKLAIPATTVWTIEKWQGLYYYATDNGLYVQKMGTRDFALVGIEGQTIHSLYPSPEGLIVVGESEIGIIKNGNYRKVPFDQKSWKKFGVVRKMIYFEDTYFLGSSNGLFQLDLKNHRIKDHKKFGSGVFTLEEDNFNRLWIGTENGLHYYDGITYKQLPLGTVSGSKFINFLEVIDNNLCAGTNNGLFLVDCSALMLVDHFGLNSGLLNLETNINSAFYDGAFLWFGTAEGLVRFDINSYENSKKSEFKPTLVSTAFNINFEAFPFKFNSINGIQTKDLKLSYAKNNISIDVDALFLSDPESVLIQYKLEGLDEKWSPPTTNNTITLNNLPDGEFTLRIRSVNGFGMESNEIQIPIYITPPYYRTWWFYLIIFVVLAAGVRYYFRWQLKRERDRNYQENLENRTRLIALEQQSLNASMNRHFIFNSLNSIQYFINTQDKNSANRYLSNFAKLIRKNLDSANENENMVSLSQELERLELYLSLEAMRFKDRFIYTIDEGDIETEQIEVPSMLLQPFVENSIIHGILPNEQQVGRIEIRMKVIGHQLEICIDDNGIGIDVSMNKKAGFVGDHKSQGMEITSKRISLIRTMLKKDYDLIGPFQIANPDQSIKGTRVLIKIPYENLDY